MSENSNDDDDDNDNTQMFASICTGYGPANAVFELRHDVPRPVLSGDDQILVRTEMTAVNPADCKQRSGNLQRISRHDFPLVLGQDFCGTVVKVGPGAAHAAKVGDTVMGSTAPRNSCSAEYLLAHPSECVTIDREKLSPASAAAAPTAYCTAWKGLFDKAYGNLPMRTEHRTEDEVNTAAAAASEEPKPDGTNTNTHKPKTDRAKSSVLIIGASGSVGSAAVQLAVGVAEVGRVVAICGTDNIDYVQSLGKDDNNSNSNTTTEMAVVDYRQPGYEHELRHERFDLILDCVGGDEYYHKFHPRLNFVNRGACYVTCVGPVLHGGSEPITYRTLLSTIGTLVPRLLGNYLLPGRWNSRYKIYLGFETTPLEPVARALEKGVLDPRIDPRSPVPLKDLASAHERVETGHSSGKVVVEIRGDR